MSRARHGFRHATRRVIASSTASLLIALSTVAPASAVGDFQLLVTPDEQLLPPGGSVAFLVQVGSVGGFAEEVTLTVGTLPDGVTFQLSDDTVTPPASAHLTLIAAEDAEVGNFPIVVRGTGGGITHEATGSVTVDFGLIPVCYARVEGTVTDRETGQPIEGVKLPIFGDVFTDAQGHYSFDQVGLGTNNAPAIYPVFGSKHGYWSETVQADFVCKQLTRVDVTLLKWQGAQAHGTVVEGTVDANDPFVVIPGQTPISGIDVRFEVSNIPGTGPDTTDADGSYRIGLDHLGADNTPLENLFLAADEGVNHIDQVYWPRSVHTPSPVSIGDLAPGEDLAVAPIGLVRKCFGSVSGTLVYGDTGLPAAGVTVVAEHTWWFFTSDVTDDSGAYEIPVIALGYNNQETDVLLRAGVSTGFYGLAESTTHFDACGDRKVVPLTLPPVLFGSVQGRVTDVETGLALPGAQVGFPNTPCQTCDPYPGIADATGDYRINRIPAAAAPDKTGYMLEASHTDYWWETDTFEISAGDVETRNFALLKRRFASLSGTVTDAITGLPIEGATGGATHDGPPTQTDAQGQYSQPKLGIGYRNEPLPGAVSFLADGYWPAQVPATFEADKPTTANLEMIPICEGATIRGRVVDATDQQPLEGASVVVIGNGNDLTDANGRYEITGVKVGTNNDPISVEVFASKQGYFSQSKTITVFCGASITIDFGRRPPHAGALEGFVTNAVTGNPISDVKIVGEFGEETKTDGDGHYLFPEVPVNDDGSAKAWNVSALPDDFPLQTKSVTVRADETARLDFQFGGVQPPATGNIVVKVVTQPAGSSQSFSFTSSYGAPFSLTDGESNDSGPLEASETYSVSQTVSDGWDMTASCDHGQTPAAIALAADTTVTCTFTNVQDGGFVLRKTNAGGPATDAWAFTVEGGPFTSCDPTQVVLAGTEQVECFADAGEVVTITEPDPGDRYILTDIDCGGAPNADIDLVNRSVTITLEAGQVTGCDFTNTFQAGESPGDVLLVIDEDSIDNGLQFNASGGPIVPAGPDRFSAFDVNDDKAGPRQREVLPYFAANVGRSITVKTGQTGDEGWFAPNCIPQKWISGTSNACLDAGTPRDTAIGNYFGIPDAAAVPAQNRLDKIPAVIPLRARGLASLVGQTVCAVVYDGDIGINYDRSTFPYTSGNLQGATLGIVAFEVNVVRKLNGFSSSTLPEVQITIVDTSVCDDFVLFNAPVSRSSSVPNDIDPQTPSTNYRNPPSFRTRVTEELFY